VEGFVLKIVQANSILVIRLLPFPALWVTIVYSLDQQNVGIIQN
jgi:hypothetical protein